MKDYSTELIIAFFAAVAGAILWGLFDMDTLGPILTGAGALSATFLMGHNHGYNEASDEISELISQEAMKLMMQEHQSTSMKDFFISPEEIHSATDNPIINDLVKHLQEGGINIGVFEITDEIANMQPDVIDVAHTEIEKDESSK